MNPDDIHPKLKTSVYEATLKQINQAIRENIDQEKRLVAAHSRIDEQDKVIEELEVKLVSLRDWCVRQLKEAK